MSKYLKFMNTAKGVQQIFTREKIGKMTSQELKKMKNEFKSN
jgi:hypothetical protein